MSDAFADIAGDREIKVLIHTGTGENYNANWGGSRSRWRSPCTARWTARRASSKLDEKAWYGRMLIENLLAVDVPMISAVNGPCNIHSEVPLLGDIVLASEDAYFQDLAHFPRGMVPGDGQHVSGPLVGRNRARYMLLTGKKLSAQEALEWGAVAEVLPKDQLLDRAWELARELAKRPPLVLRYTRQLFTQDLKRAFLDELGHGLARETYAQRQFFPSAAAWRRSTGRGTRTPGRTDQAAREQRHRPRAMAPGSQLDERRNVARGEQPPSHVEDDLVGRPEEPLERHRPLQEPMEPVLRGEADAGEHLLAVPGHRARRASGDGLREGGRLGARLLPGRRERGLEGLHRDQAFREPVAHGLESRDRTTELHPLQSVGPREVQHGSAGACDLVRDRAPAEGDGRGPCGGIEARGALRAALHADRVQASVGIDPAYAPHLGGRRRNGDAPMPPTPWPRPPAAPERGRRERWRARSRGCRSRRYAPVRPRRRKAAEGRRGRRAAPARAPT